MDAVGCNDDVAFDDHAVGERHTRDVTSLLEAYAAMSRAHHAWRQSARQHLDQVGAVHAERGVPACGVRHLNRGYRRAVMAEIVRTVADPGAPSFHLMSQTYPLQLPHAVRRQKHPCPDFAERGACS